MRTSDNIGFKRAIRSAAISLACVTLGSAGSAMADPIPYPNQQQYNPNTYSFTAKTTADVTGYFVGSDAGYDNQVGLLDNGVLTAAGFGLDDHSSSIGQSFDFGPVNAGDSLVFVMDNLSLGSDVYSDPSLNAAYDSPGDTVGHNHVYSTAYTATSPIFGSVPVGTFVAFEDERFPDSDFSYNDENFVFSNVATNVPEPASMGLIGIGFVVAWRAFRRAPRLRAIPVQRHD